MALFFRTLFVAYFNFLRTHSAIEGKVPVLNPELQQLPSMPARWSKLIGLAQEWIIGAAICEANSWQTELTNGLYWK